MTCYEEQYTKTCFTSSFKVKQVPILHGNKTGIYFCGTQGYIKLFDWCAVFWFLLCRIARGRLTSSILFLPFFKVVIGWYSPDIRKLSARLNIGKKIDKYCWISNNNTLDIPCTPNAQEARRPLFEFDFTITSPVIWIYRTVTDPKNWMRKKSLWEFLLILNWLP